MDNVKPFQDRDVVGICAYLSKYCEIYINAHGADLNRSEVKTFHVFFPTLLTYIFGSPNTKYVHTLTTFSKYKNLPFSILEDGFKQKHMLRKTLQSKSFFQSMVNSSKHY
jgi:hypothetical protein